MAYIHKIFSCTVLACCLLNSCPTQAINFKQYVEDAYNFIRPASPEKALWQKPLFLAAVSVAGISATAAAIYAYVTRFNLHDAHNLSIKIHTFIENTSHLYNREIEILTDPIDSETLKINLNAVITEPVLARPYLTYVTQAEKSFKECENLLKKVEKGITKLNDKYHSIIASSCTLCPLEDRKYELIIEELSILRDQLSELYDLLGTLCKYCWQSDQYKQEKQQAQLEELNNTMSAVQAGLFMHACQPPQHITVYYY